MHESEVLALVGGCSNVGRWGPDDPLGTLNHITPDKTLAALRLPRSGRVVSIALDLMVAGSRQDPPSAGLSPRYRPADGPFDAHDTLTLNIHGHEATHMDAPGHVYFDGTSWGGHDVADIARPEGLAFGSVLPLAQHGVVTRGVLLDVAALWGIEFLQAGAGIGAADLGDAAGRAGVTIEAGDAIFIRAGHEVRKAREGAAHDEGGPHEGVLPDVLPWLYEHDVAVFAADCIEQRPSGYPRLPLPLHQIGLASMGLCILDVPDVEALAVACAEEGRNDFLLMASPLRIPGGTGSAVNPLAVF